MQEAFSSSAFQWVPADSPSTQTTRCSTTRLWRREPFLKGTQRTSGNLQTARDVRKTTADLDNVTVDSGSCRVELLIIICTRALHPHAESKEATSFRFCTKLRFQPSVLEIPQGCLDCTVSSSHSTDRFRVTGSTGSAMVGDKAFTQHFQARQVSKASTPHSSKASGFLPIRPLQLEVEPGGPAASESSGEQHCGLGTQSFCFSFPLSLDKV